MNEVEHRLANSVLLDWSAATIRLGSIKAEK